MTNEERAEKYKKVVADAFNSALSSMDKERIESRIIKLVSDYKDKLIRDYLGIEHHWTSEWKVLENGRLDEYLKSLGINDSAIKLLDGLDLTPSKETLKKYQELYKREYEKYIKRALIQKAERDAYDYVEKFVNEQFGDE